MIEIVLGFLIAMPVIIGTYHLDHMGKRDWNMSIGDFVIGTIVVAIFAVMCMGLYWSGTERVKCEKAAAPYAAKVINSQCYRMDEVGNWLLIPVSEDEMP